MHSPPEPLDTTPPAPRSTGRTGCITSAHPALSDTARIHGVRAHVMLTREGRDFNHSVLRFGEESPRKARNSSVQQDTRLYGYLTLPADQTLVQPTDVLSVTAVGEPYNHKGRWFIKVWLKKRVSIPVMVQRYRAQKRRQKRTPVLTRQRRSSRVADTAAEGRKGRSEASSRYAVLAVSSDEDDATDE